MSERKTEQAKALLVRYIRDQQLQAGEKLPPQDFLRQQFKFGTTTIGAAIRELKDDGVLEVRDKVGVFVIDPKADGHAGRVIGLTAMSRDISAYYSSMLCFLQLELGKYGCRTEIFCCERPGFRTEFKVNEFPGLRRCIERGELDGLMSLDSFTGEAYEYFRQKKIPTVMVGNVCNVDNAVFIDEVSVLRRALPKMRELHAERIAVVLSTGLWVAGRDYLGTVLEEFGIPENRVFCGRTAADGGAIAQKILAMPPEKRPDAWVAFDDVIAGALACSLALRLPIAELPAAAILTNGNVGFSFPVPRLYLYENHLNRFAAMGVELLLANITGTTVEKGQRWYMPEERRIFLDK